MVPNQTVATLRIYKDKLRRFYMSRYRKEKITAFFDYEYIEDYDSQLAYLETLLSLKIDEIHYLCFLVLDQNGDGLICNTDLFSLATASSPENHLINKDIFKLYEVIRANQNMRYSQSIIDSISDEDFFKN